LAVPYTLYSVFVEAVSFRRISFYHSIIIPFLLQVTIVSMKLEWDWPRVGTSRRIYIEILGLLISMMKKLPNASVFIPYLRRLGR
jgi:hypothetical protein